MSVQNCEICGEPGLFSETIGEGNLRRIVHPHKDATFVHPMCTRTYESLAGEYKGKGQTYLMGKQTDNSIRCICQTWTGRADWVEGHHPNCDGSGNIVTPPESAKYEQVAGLMVEKAVGAIPGITKPTGIEDGNTKPTAVDEPELQLLILDMGDVCIVRVEQGDGKFPHKTLGIGTAWALNNTYLDKRPFTELRSAIDGEKPVPRIERRDNRESPWVYQLFDISGADKNYLTPAEYTALSELAGKPLPIYEGGKWEELIALQSKDEYGDWIDKRDFTAWRYTR